MWNTLRDAIHNVWPNLKEWIMNIPLAKTTVWFTGADGIGVHCRPAHRHQAFQLRASRIFQYVFSPTRLRNEISRDSLCLSSSFIAVSQNAYNAACALVQDLAGRDRDLRCLLDAGINPFFIIYACADCGISLPHRLQPRTFLETLGCNHPGAVLARSRGQSRIYDSGEHPRRSTGDALKVLAERTTTRRESSGR
jgi:hypothetical protein